MDYTRPNHVPTPEEIAAQTRRESGCLVAFAVAIVAITITAALVFGSQIH